MALFLRETDVAALVSMDDVIDAVERGFRDYGAGRAVNRTRQRVSINGGTLHVMAAGLPGWGVFGLKSYAVTHDGRRFVSLLYSAESGDLLAIMEADTLGRLRTGAASAVATRYLAKTDAGSVGILGSGGQARTQLQAIARVRPVALVKVFSRTQPQRQAFAEEMVEELGAEVVAVDTPEEAVSDVDIIVTITSARDPVLRGEWLHPGVHINAAGSNAAARRELDAQAVGRASRVVVDARDQAMIEAGDLIGAVEAGTLSWERVEELGPIVSGSSAGRSSSDDITLFESQGIALEDVATMHLIYARAKEARRGEEIAR